MTYLLIILLNLGINIDSLSKEKLDTIVHAYELEEVKLEDIRIENIGAN